MGSILSKQARNEHCPSTAPETTPTSTSRVVQGEPAQASKSTETFEHIENVTPVHRHSTKIYYIPLYVYSPKIYFSLIAFRMVQNSRDARSQRRTDFGPRS
ncbi:hypothetical protein BDV29DRAFT_154754 [Aspergillus leporis]|uniref:Uncharacterized protein n=1 Tax=Aspergillus leporis TaxID=41062 RepID=A0A5N5X6W8_9EURO|nr:hypothetical protein BDV29DRAFT_154754 [Aspergillus leporis]